MVVKSGSQAMSDETSYQDLFMVAVSPDKIKAEQLRDRLSELCQICDLLPPAQGRILCQKPGWMACEMAIQARPDQLAEIRSTITSARSDALSQLFRMDVAILPAEGRRKRLLISDMDSTIIQQECLDELADFAGLKVEISEVTQRAMRGEIDFETALEQRVSKLAGLPLSALEACYKEKISLMPGARTLTASMQAQGAYCLLVSGGFTYFTSRIAASAGFQADRGNILLDDGKYLTGKVGRPILGRQAKRDSLDDAAYANGLTRKDALAMGDGANDLAMIEAAGLGLAVHAKPVIAQAADAAIEHTDLVTALFYQGYSEDQIIWQS